MLHMAPQRDERLRCVAQLAHQGIMGNVAISSPLKAEISSSDAIEGIETARRACERIGRW